MRFKFVTGEVIVVSDEDIAKILRRDKRYEEIKAEPKQEEPKKKPTKRGDK